jgi:hypothetical protein
LLLPLPREGRRRDQPEEGPEEPRKGGSTFDELAGRARPPEPPRGGTSWRPLGGASRFQPPPDDNGYPIEGWWDTFQGERKDKDANAWGGGRTGPWWERRKKKGWGWGRLLEGPAASDDGPPSERPLPPRGDRRREYQRAPEDEDPLDAGPLTPEEQALDDQLQNLVKPRRVPSDWNDWLDDSYSNKYSDYVGGAGSGWYEEESEWLKGGNPRLPPDIPERGMSRTIKELVLRVFEPVDEVGDDLAFEERVFRFTTQETVRVALIRQRPSLDVASRSSLLTHCNSEISTFFYVRVCLIVLRLLPVLESLRLLSTQAAFSQYILIACPVLLLHCLLFMHKNVHAISSRRRCVTLTALVYLGMAGQVLVGHPLRHHCNGLDSTRLCSRALHEKVRPPATFLP